MATMQQTKTVPGVSLGEITGVGNDGAPLVRCGQRRPVAALVAMTPPADWRTCAGKQAVIAFVDGDESRPAILGVIGLGVIGMPTTPAATPRTLRVSAGEELVIECGKSKIWLRADGRIEIRGEHVVSRSRGPNKVKGGTVHIN